MSDCAFCDIISGKKYASIIYQDDQILAFLDHRPIRIGHTLVISKKHYETILDIPDDELASLILVTKRLAGQIKKSLDAKGLRISNNNYPAANQQVPHIHFHIIPASAEAPFKLKFERIKASKPDLDEIAEKIRMAGRD